MQLIFTSAVYQLIPSQLISRILKEKRIKLLLVIFGSTYESLQSILFKGYSTLAVYYRDLQARVHEQETRNLTLHEAQPSAVLNFEFLVRERVLVNPIIHEQRVLKTF